jgi:molybdopterin molybdotransferase
VRGLIDVREAMSIVRREALGGGSGVESVALEEAIGRVLAGEVVSPIDSPPFDKSTRDGFALAAENGGAGFRVRETIAAGAAQGRSLLPGECARIMTGAELPPGADRVASKECVEVRDGVARVLRREREANVVRRGENLSRGGIVMRPKVIAAQDIGILAASGIAVVRVSVPPSIGILCTGEEVRSPGLPLGPGQIYDSNGPQLEAQLRAMGCPARRRGIVGDDPAKLTEEIARALEEHEVLILSGGVSVGDFDYASKCLEDVGAKILFHGVAVKPGKPALFARRGDSWIFGVPGNPVSTFVIFEILVKPFLYGRMGLEWEPRVFRGFLGKTVRRADVQRLEYLPVHSRGDVVTPVAFQGSAHLNALGDADGLIVIERGVARLKRGTRIDVRQI